LRKLNRTTFALAYTHIDHLPVQRLWNRYLELIMRGTYESVQDRLPRARFGPGPHVAMISSHFRPSTVDNYFCQWYPIWRQESARLSVVVLGEANQRSQAICADADRFLLVGNHYGHLDQVLDFLTEEPPDLVFYPEVGMEPFVQMLASLRLAQVQCCTWGHPLSTGLASMDYYLSAADLEPADADSHYSERLLRLPGLGTVFDPEYWGTELEIRNHGHSCFLCEIVIRSQFHTTYEPGSIKCKAWGA
jgi:Predicted O-linked N-acetylglucosamine transferase, SPINDLY family